MQEWNSLAQRMILGSDANAAPFQSDNAILQPLFQALQARPAPQQLLHALAGLQWLRKLGSSFQHAALESDPAHDSLPTCNAAVTSLLRTALQTKQLPLLLEIFQRMQQHNQVLPADLLVDGLTLAESHPLLQSTIAGTLGNRGHWLAQQNPAWQFAAQPDWHQLQGEQLLTHLRILRDAAPDRFLQTVETLWPSLAAKDRQKLLTLFEPVPQSDAHAFLTRCRQDRSQAVRQLATRLLIRLQDASLLEQVSATVSAHVRLTSGGLLRRSQLETNLPEAFDSTWESAGIQENLEYIEPLGKVGRKSSWLHQWLALLPSQRLLTTLNTDAETYLKLAAKHDHATTLLSAWANAALLHDDAEALRTLLPQIPAKQMANWQRALMPMAHDACRDLLLLSALQSPTEKDTPALATVLNHLEWNHPLSPSLSMLLLEHLLRDVDKIPYWYQGLQQRIDQLPFALEPQQLPHWIARLEPNTPARLEGCLRWLHSRHQLLQELPS